MEQDNRDQELEEQEQERKIRRIVQNSLIASAKSGGRILDGRVANVHEDHLERGVRQDSTVAIVSSWSLTTRADTI